MSRRLVVLALLAAFAAPASAQSIWLDREHRPSVLAEVYFPQFDGGGTNFPTWTWFAAARLPVGNSSAFVFELPYAHGDVGDAPFDESQGSIGNPYVGIEYRPHPTGLLLEAGLRAPAASDTKELPFIVGYLTDVERQEAFVPNQLPVRFGLHYHHAPGPDALVSWDLRLVPSVWIQTSDEGPFDSELFFGYGGMVRYEGEQVRVGGGLTGRWNATSDGADFGEASEHQLDLAADFLGGSVRPGFQLKVPLDDGLTSVLDVTWGLSVTILP
jgi:hypothetical protein